MKRIVFCFDGTWNKIDGDYPTNVARIAQSVCHVADSVGQIIHYDEGVGTTKLDRGIGGAFGYGLSENIAEAYHFLVLNYEIGDELFVFGFSRGAYTARSFVGLLRNCGIISRRSLQHIRGAVELYRDRSPGAAPSSERARQFRVDHCPELTLPGDREWRAAKFPGRVFPPSHDLTVKYLGVFDTVPALGIPSHLGLLARVNRKLRFHDHQLSHFVEAARHAVSADERRRSFVPSLWTNLEDLNHGKPHMPYRQLIFPGVHGAVGGGGPVRGLSDAALQWIVEGARAQALAFDLDPASPLHQLSPDPRAQLFNATGKFGWSWSDWAMGAGLGDRVFSDVNLTELHPSLVRRFAASSDALPEKRAYRPPSLRHLWPAIETQVAGQAAAEAPLVDERELTAPTIVRRYEIKAGDTLSQIAASEMAGTEDMDVLFRHNQRAGILYDADEIHAGQEIEIPVYGQEQADGRSPLARPEEEDGGGR